MHTIDLEKIALDVDPQIWASIAKFDPSASNIDCNELEKIFALNQGMTSVIMRIANSKFFAHGKQIETLKHAIDILGFRMLRALTMLVSTRSLFGQNMYARFKHHVCQPSIATALIAREIGLKLKHRERSEEYFMLGFLHKLGQVIFNVFDKSQFIKVLNELDKKERPSLEIEKEYFQTDHVEIGHQAALAWSLPPIYKESIQYHRQLDKVADEVSKESQVYIYILGLASYIVNKSNFGYLPDVIEENFKIATDALQIQENQLIYLTKEYLTKLIYNADYKYYLSLL